MGLLGGRHLHHMLGLGRVDDVRHQGIVGKPLHRQGWLQGAPAHPAGTDADRQAADAQRQGPPPADRAGLAGCLRPLCRCQDGRRNAALRHGFVQQRIERAMQPPVDPAPRCHFGGSGGVRGQVRLHRGTPHGGQAAVDVGVEFFDVDGSGGHGRPHFTRCNVAPLSPDAAGAPSSATRMRSRARDSRDITVPSGTPSTSAASR